MDNLYSLLSILIFFSMIGLALAMGSIRDKNISISSFNNQFLSFNYPDHLKIVDQSSINHCKIYIFNGNPERIESTDPKYVGKISKNDSEFASSIKGPTKNIKINGIPALEYHKDVFSNEIFLPSKLIVLKFNTNSQTNSKPFSSIYSELINKNKAETAYNVIKKSLQIN